MLLVPDPNDPNHLYLNLYRAFQRATPEARKAVLDFFPGPVDSRVAAAVRHSLSDPAALLLPPDSSSPEITPGEIELMIQVLH